MLTPLTFVKLYTRVQKWFATPPPPRFHLYPHIFSLIPCLRSPPPISNVDHLDSTTLCNTKITIFNIDMGEGGKNSSHITEKLRKMHIPKIFVQDCRFCYEISHTRTDQTA
jgi:hypothetical protein